MTEFILIWIAAGIVTAGICIDLTLMRIASALEEIGRKFK